MPARAHAAEIAYNLIKSVVYMYSLLDLPWVASAYMRSLASKNGQGTAAISMGLG